MFQKIILYTVKEYQKRCFKKKKRKMREKGLRKQERQREGKNKSRKKRKNHLWGPTNQK